MHSPLPHDPATLSLLGAALVFVAGGVCWAKMHCGDWLRRRRDRRDPMA